MTRAEFWKLIDRMKKRSGEDLEELTSLLSESLRTLPATEILDFAQHYAATRSEANTRLVWEAALVIGCGDSDDGYADFLSWVPLQGKKMFERILADPDCLADYQPEADMIENWYCEYAFELAAAYQEVAGEPLPDIPCNAFLFSGPSSSKKKLAATFPRLTERVQAAKADGGTGRVDLGPNGMMGVTLVSVTAEENGAIARFVFDNGVELRVRDYWEFYSQRYQIERKTASYEDHPMVGQRIVYDNSAFPKHIFVWFENARRLQIFSGRVGASQYDYEFEAYLHGQRVN
ncbi:DUF4240 domain-containing protein [Blastopirellula marina]|uniref:DUF4240 domain-containing protein n=1 Tax=Blastopirellula marina TaxID=124 RepID=A0A2S8GI22_9BACT|nr:DUF4240 domain-containing protein [Blastopirellula marina]PQO44088.1 hypothetical protein C5Y93_21365 [Blastopirellula marina]